MTRSLKTGLTLFCGSLLPLWLPGSAYAIDELDQIQAERAQSQVNYLHQVHQNPNMSAADKMNLYNQTMSGPEQKIEAMQERGDAERQKRFEDQRKKMTEAGVVLPGPASAPVITAQGKTATPPVDEGRGLARPQFILDGSRIPKEVSFPGAKANR